MAQNAARRYLIAIVILTSSVAVFVLGGSVESLNAQGSMTNMRSLLENLTDRMLNEDGFQVAIRFAEPLIPEDDLVWILPDRRDSDTDEITRAIAEVGDDYICFDITGGAARFMECTPFSNIVSVRYFVQ